MSTTARFAWALLPLALAGSAHAQVSRELLFQGRLQELAGGPGTPTATMTLRFWDQPSGGAASWVETRTVDLDSLGRFQVSLGGDDLSPYVFDSRVYLGITLDEALGGTEIQPRVPAAGVATSLLAIHAGEVSQPRSTRIEATGTASENGAELLAAVAAASPSPTDPEEIHLAPGDYDVGAGGLVLKSYLALRGAGRSRVLITGGAASTPVLELADGCLVEDLQAQFTGTGLGRWVARAASVDATLRRVNLRVDGGGGINAAYGLRVEGTSTVRAEDVFLRTDNAFTCVPVLVSGTSSTLEANGLSTLSPGSCSNATGIFSQGSLRLHSGALEVVGSSHATGLRVDSGTAWVSDTDVQVTGTTSTAQGLDVRGGVVRLRQLSLYAAGAAGALGVENDGGDVLVQASSVRSGSDTGVGTSGTLRFEHTLLAGPSVSGSVSCFHCYGTSFTTSGPASCP